MVLSIAISKVCFSCPNSAYTAYTVCVLNDETKLPSQIIWSSYLTEGITIILNVKNNIAAININPRGQVSSFKTLKVRATQN